MLRRRCAVLLFIVRGHLVLDISDQRYPNFSGVIAPQHVTDKMGFDLHLNLHRKIGQSMSMEVYFIESSKGQIAGSHLPSQAPLVALHTGYSRTKAHPVPDHHPGVRQSRPVGSPPRRGRIVCCRWSNW